MKLGKYLKNLATTDIDIYSEFSHQYSHMPYDEAQQYREYLLSLSISDVEDIFEKIIKPKASFTDINLDNNKEKFIAFLKALRRPEDDINDWIKIKENKTKTNKNDSVTFKLNTTNEKIADFYSYLVKMNYLEEGHAKDFISVFSGRNVLLTDGQIRWLKANYILRELLKQITDSKLFEFKEFSSEHWSIIPKIFKSKNGINERNIQWASSTTLKATDAEIITNAIKMLK